MPDPQALTRRELYELVWSMPKQNLAAQFGVTRKALPLGFLAPDLQRAILQGRPPPADAERGRAALLGGPA